MIPAEREYDKWGKTRRRLELCGSVSVRVRVSKVSEIESFTVQADQLPTNLNVGSSINKTYPAKPNNESTTTKVSSNKRYDPNVWKHLVSKTAKKIWVIWTTKIRIQKALKKHELFGTINSKGASHSEKAQKKARGNSFNFLYTKKNPSHPSISISVSLSFFFCFLFFLFWTSQSLLLFFWSQSVITEVIMCLSTCMYISYNSAGSAASAAAVMAAVGNFDHGGNSGIYELVAAMEETTAGTGRVTTGSAAGIAATGTTDGVATGIGGAAGGGSPSAYAYTMTS